MIGMLMETPSNLMTPTIFSQTVKNRLDSLESKDVEIKIHDFEWIKQQKMGCFESVILTKKKKNLTNQKNKIIQLKTNRLPEEVITHLYFLK